MFIGSTVSIVFVTIPACGGDRDDVAHVISSLFFVSGLITLTQTLLGDRLPAVQGGTFAYIQPILGVAALVSARGGWKSTDGPDPDRFVATMREISGACIGAGLVVAGIAASGLLRVCLRFISPLVIASNIAAVGLTLYGAGFARMSDCWGLSLSTLALLLLFTLYLRNVRVPLGRRLTVKPFESVPVILAVAAAWAGAGIATAAGAWRNAPAATRAACATTSDLVARAAWVRIPYPGEYGAPTFSAASVLIVLGGAITAAAQSLGDYYLVARVSGAPVPPPAVVSRAVFVQGLTCAFAGAFPTGTGSTVYNENAAVLVLSRVGSRVVVQAAACVAIFVAVVPKLTAAIASLPPATVAALFVLMFSTVSGVGLSMLEYVDMHASVRNPAIVGLCIFTALSVPDWASAERYAATGGPIVTRAPAINAILNALLKSGSVLALILGLILDNTVPAAPGERGLAAWHAAHDDADAWWRVPDLVAVYGLPFGVSVRLGEAGERARAWLRSKLNRGGGNRRKRAGDAESPPAGG